MARETYREVFLLESEEDVRPGGLYRGLPSRALDTVKDGQGGL